MQAITTEVIFATLFFGTILTVALTVARYVYLIRKSMIEYGMEPERSLRREKVIYLVGILIGLGGGLIVSSIFVAMQLEEDTTDLLVWGTIGICTGLGLLAAHKKASAGGDG